MRVLDTDYQFRTVAWLLNYSRGLSDIIQLLVLVITMIMMMMMIIILFSEAELAKVGDYN